MQERIFLLYLERTQGCASGIKRCIFLAAYQLRAECVLGDSEGAEGRLAEGSM